MRECSKCGEKIRDGAIFCPYCGAGQNSSSRADYENSAIGQFKMENYPVKGQFHSNSSSIWSGYLKICSYLIAVVEFFSIVGSARKVNGFLSEFTDSSGGWIIFLGIVIGAIISFTTLALFMVIISTVDNVAASKEELKKINEKLDRQSNK